MATNTEWSITLCAPGACTDCMYAYCCTPCALAQARTNLDGTSCCLNFLLGNAISMRWMIRTAYGIQGDECSDCFTTLCCPCCVVNQMYQTTKTLGDPFGPMPGAHMERGQEWASANEPCDCGSCCCACFCMYCAQGRILQDSMGMSSWMGCCCVNPCFARNMVKVHYRVGKADDDCCNDALIPCLISLPVGGIAVYPYLVYFLMQMAAETKVRGQCVQPRYIAGYNPQNPASPGWQTMGNGGDPIPPASSTGTPYNAYNPQPPYSIQQQQPQGPQGGYYTPGPPDQSRY